MNDKDKRIDRPVPAGIENVRVVCAVVIVGVAETAPVGKLIDTETSAELVPKFVPVTVTVNPPKVDFDDDVMVEIVGAA